MKTFCCSGTYKFFKINCFILIKYIFSDSSSKDLKSLGGLKDVKSFSDYKDPKSFSWDIYLKGTSSVAAPSRAFKQRPPCGFKRGMKLEAVDKRLPQLIRVATVEDVKDHM